MSMRNRMHRLPFFVAAALAGCSPANDGADAAAPDASALVDGGCLAMSCDAGGGGPDLGGPDGPVDRVTLADGWKLASSAEVSDDGATVASAGYAADGWSPIRVPATVLAGLVQNGIHADLYYSDTLQRIDAAPFTRARPACSGRYPPRGWAKSSSRRARASASACAPASPAFAAADSARSTKA